MTKAALHANTPTNAIAAFKRQREAKARKSTIPPLPNDIQPDPRPDEGKPAVDLYNEKPKKKRRDLHSYLSDAHRAKLDEMLMDLRARKGRGKNLPEVLEWLIDHGHPAWFGKDNSIT